MGLFDWFGGKDPEEIKELKKEAKNLLERGKEAWLESKLDPMDSSKREKYQNLFQESLELVEEVLSDTKDSESLKMKGIILRAKSYYPDSIECFQEALEMNDQDFENWRGKGITFGAQEMYRKAIKCFDKSLEIEPENSRTWREKGISLIQINKDEKAVKCFDKALEIDSDDFRNWYWKGFSLNVQDQHQKAVENLDKAIDLEPRLYQSWKTKGASLSLLEKHEEALEALTKAFEIFPKDQETIQMIYVLIPKVYRDKWEKLDPSEIDKEEIKRKLDDLEEMMPRQKFFPESDDPEEIVWGTKALLASMDGDYSKAIEHANKGLEKFPESPYLLYLRGRSKGDLRKFESGIEDLNKVIELDSEFSDAFVERGYIKQMMGDMKEARKDYKKAKELEPSVILPSSKHGAWKY